MNKKWLLIAGCGLCLLLAGCEKKTENVSAGNLQTENSGSEETGQDFRSSSTSEGTSMPEYEAKLAEDGLSVQEYRQLVQLYSQRNQVKKQRDLLEQS